jgi:hypothetical protein
MLELKQNFPGDSLIRRGPDYLKVVFEQAAEEVLLLSGAGRGAVSIRDRGLA